MIWSGHHRPVVALHRLGGGLDVALPRHVVVEHLDQRRGQRVGVVDRHQAPGGTVEQHPAERVEVAGHHRGAGGHRLDEHDAEALAAGVGCAVHVGTAQRRRLLGVVDLPEEPQVIAQFTCLASQFVLVAAADDQDLDIGKPRYQRGQRTEQHRHPLARLVEAAQEQHRLAGPRIALEAAAAPSERTRHRPRWGSPPRPSPAPPSASGAPGRTPRCGRRSSRARAAGGPGRRRASTIWWSRCGRSRRSAPRRSSAPASTGSARWARAGAVRRTRLR